MEIYISTDIEADGPIPGLYSMLSFASAAYTTKKELIGTFSVNLKTLENVSTHPETMSWWQTQPEAWKACRSNCIEPKVAMQNHSNWLKQLAGKPIFVGYPAAYDFMFIYWYLIKFTGSSPFSHSAIDIKTMAISLLKTEYLEIKKSTFPKEWFDDLPHTHIALDDAIAQGALFCNMLKLI